MVAVASVALAFLMCAALSFLCFYAAYLLEKAQERKNARKQLMASAIQQNLAFKKSAKASSSWR